MKVPLAPSVTERNTIADHITAPRFARQRSGGDSSTVDLQHTDACSSVSSIPSRGHSSLRNQSDFPRDLNLSAFQGSIYFTYLFETFFDGGQVDEATFTHQTWIAESSASAGIDAAQLALKAFAATYFARRHGHDTRLLAYADRLYGDALRQLSLDISNPASYLSHSNVSASLALNYYEIWAFSQSEGWIQHAGGVGTLIEKLGPAYFQDYPAHGVFLLARPLVLYRACVLREATFLAKDEWQTVPWMLHPETKIEEQKLMDYCVHVPGMMGWRRELDDLATSGQDVFLRMEKLKENIITLGKKIVSWRMQWELNHPFCAWEKPVVSDTGLAVDSEGKTLYNSVLYFESFARSKEIALYNTLFGMLLHYARDSPQGDFTERLFEDWPLDRCPQPTNPLQLPTRELSIFHCATEICRSVEYELLERQALSACFYLVLPVRVRYDKPTLQLLRDLRKDTR